MLKNRIVKIALNARALKQQLQKHKIQMDSLKHLAISIAAVLTS